MASALVLLALCLASAGLSALICSFAGVLGPALGLVDHPDGSLKRHVEGVPLIGGLALLLPSLSLTTLYLLYGAEAPYMFAIIGGAFVTMMLGVIDDRVGLTARVRLLAFIVIVFGVFALDPLSVLNALRLGTSVYDVGISLGLFALPFTAIVVIGFVNAANMADGMNGQLIGSLIIWSLFLSRYLGFDTGLPLGIPFAIFACSAFVVFLFNMRERVFSGSAGAYGASLFIALSTIAAYRRGGALSAIEPILWFWLPTLDCVRVMTQRMHLGASPFSGDRNHIHHILQDVFGPRMALPIYLLLLAAPGATAAFGQGRIGGSLVLLVCLILYGLIVYLEPTGLRSAIRKLTPYLPAAAQPIRTGAVQISKPQAGGKSS